MFKINVHKLKDDAFILNLHGHLTADHSVTFHKALIPILQKRPKAVSINLSDVDTIDDAGIAMLMNSLMGISQYGTYFYLIGLPCKIKEYYQALSEDFGHPYFSNTTH